MTKQAQSAVSHLRIFGVNTFQHLSEINFAERPVTVRYRCDNRAHMDSSSLAKWIHVDRFSVGAPDICPAPDITVAARVQIPSVFGAKLLCCTKSSHHAPGHPQLRQFLPARWSRSRVASASHCIRIDRTKPHNTCALERPCESTSRGRRTACPVSDIEPQ
jgi:hypothetical protein